MDNRYQNNPPTGSENPPSTLKTDPLSTEHFKEHLLGIPTLEDKFSYFKSQFQPTHDPLTLYDSQAQLSNTLQLNSLSNQLQIHHLCYIQVFLDHMASFIAEPSTLIVQTSQQTVDQPQQQMKGGRLSQHNLPLTVEGLVFYLPQIQSLITLAMTKLYSQAMLQQHMEQEDRSKIYITLASWVHYMLTSHLQRLKPGFIVNVKVSEAITAVLNFQKTDQSAENARRIESLVYSVFIISCAMFQVSQTQNKQLDNLSVLLLPLLKLLTTNDCFFQPLPASFRSITISHSLLSLSQSDFLSQLLSPSPFSLAYLILRSWQQALIVIRARQTTGKPQTLAATTLEKLSPLIQIVALRLIKAVTTGDSESGSWVSEQTKKEITDKLTNDLAGQSNELRESREAQDNWVKVSQLTLSIAVDTSLSLANQPQSQTLARLSFDLLKVLINFLSTQNLMPSEEHFMSEPPIINLKDIIDHPELPCPLITSFQQLNPYLLMKENQTFFEYVYLQYLDIAKILLSQQSQNPYICSVYLSFLDKLLTDNSLSAQIHMSQMVSEQQQTQSSIVMTVTGHLLEFFDKFNYPDNRMKDVENSTANLTSKQCYQALVYKLKHYDQGGSSTGRLTSLQIVNKALVQQQAFDLISYFAHFMPKVNELCLKHVSTQIKSSTFQTSQARFYQLLKLALSLIQQGGIKSNIGVYEILCTNQSYYKSIFDSRDPIPRLQDTKNYQSNNEFKTWQAIQQYRGQSNELYMNFWKEIANKVKLHLGAKVQQIKTQVSGAISSSSSRRQDNIQQMLRKQSSQTSLAPSQSQQNQTEALLMNELSFINIKKFLIFGLTNLDVANFLYRPMKEILKEKDFEHSFEVKLAIYQSLLIIKDQSPQQEDVLKALSSLLRQIYDYIGSVLATYKATATSAAGGNMLNSAISSSVRKFNERGVEENSTQTAAYEQERDSKVKFIRYIIGQSIWILTNYINFKESNFNYTTNQPSNQSMLNSSTIQNTFTSQKSQVKELNILQYKEAFELVVTYLKKIVIRSETFGGSLTEQLLRMYFFERKELQNLCLIIKNSDNEFLKDQRGQYLIEQILLFTVECTEQMFASGVNVVQCCVTILHQKLITTSINNNKGSNLYGQQHQMLVRFLNSLNEKSIGYIKKIMIFIREKEDLLKEWCKALKELVIFALSAAPQTILYKHFFSFFREIFYYYKDMDKVDYDLARDTLQIFNHVLVQSQQANQSEILQVRGSNKDQIKIQDYFMFSNALTPGLIVHEQLKIPQESFSIALMFKLNLAQIKEMQKKNDRFGALNGGGALSMTVLQFIDKSLNEIFLPFTFMINVVNDQIKIHDYEAKIDENWHLLLLEFNFKKKKQIFQHNKNYWKVKIYIDSLNKEINGTTPLQHIFHKSNEHIVAYGCDSTDMLNGIRPSTAMPSHQLSMQMTQIQSQALNQDFKAMSTFQGCLSLPFMFTKFDKKSQSDSVKRVFSDFVIDSITNKQLVSVTTNDLLAYLKSQVKVTQKDTQLGQFESHDDFNEEVIQRHERGCSIKHLATIHRQLPHDIIVVLGGFKLLYPIFERSMQSNLTIPQKGDLWKHLFKILKTFITTDPQHIFRLYKGKYLIQTLRSCIIRAGLSHNIISIDLVKELLDIARNANNFKQSRVLDDFFRRYIFEIVLDETVCDLTFIDLKKNRKAKIFEEVAEAVYTMFTEEEKQRDKIDRNTKQLMGSTKITKMQEESKLGDISYGDVKFFFTQETAKEIYHLIFKLIVRYAEPDYIQHTQNLSIILIKLIIADQQKDNFIKLLESLQDTKKRQTLPKATLLAMLEIFEGIIKHQSFNQSVVLYEVLKNNYRKELMEQHLNQASSLNKLIANPVQGNDGSLEDDIIATTLRILIEVQLKLYDHARPIPTPRHYQLQETNFGTNYYDDFKSEFIVQLYTQLSKNPIGIQLQKTLCSLIMTSLERKQKLKVKSTQYTFAAVRYNAQFLKECIKDRQNNNILKIMMGKDFDHDLFKLAIRLFKWYDTSTKMLILEFYRDLIEEWSLNSNIEDFQSFMHLQFLEFIKDIMDKKQEGYILKLIRQSLLANREPEVVNFAERIVSSLIKCFFNTSLQCISTEDGSIGRSIAGMASLADDSMTLDEFKYLQTIKKLFAILEPMNDILLSVIKEVLRHIQEVANWVWSYVLHDTNRTNLNIKLLLFLQVIEEILTKKFNKVKYPEAPGILQSESFYEVLARLIIVFEHTKLIYFDYPNPMIIETNKRDTIKTGIIRNIDALRLQEPLGKGDESKLDTFIQGGPLRVFLSFFFQLIRMLKPNKHLSDEQKSSEGTKRSKDRYHQYGGGGPYMSNRSKEIDLMGGSTAYDLVIEMFRYYLFKEESGFISLFRPIPTIEPDCATQGRCQAPLFKIMFNKNSAKKNQYVLQPSDLTKQYIEMHNDIQDPTSFEIRQADTSDTVAQTLGFLALILVNETFDLIKRKYAQQRQEISKAQNFEETQRINIEYKHQLISLLRLLYDVYRQAYVSCDIQDSPGTIMLTITDPRLKEEIYSHLNPLRGTSVKTRQAHKAKPYTLGKACLYQGGYANQDQRIKDSEIEIGNYPGAIMTSEAGETPSGGNEGAILAQLKEAHFLRMNSKVQLANLTQPQFDELRLSSPGANDQNQDPEQLFADAALDTIQKVEQQEKMHLTKDKGHFESEVVVFVDQCFDLLECYFNPKCSTTPGSGDSTPQTPQGPLIDEEEFISKFWKGFIENERFQQIIYSIRLVSSDKFKYVHSLSLSKPSNANTESKRFQIFNEERKEETDLLRTPKQDLLQSTESLRHPNQTTDNKAINTLEASMSSPMKSPTPYQETEQSIKLQGVAPSLKQLHSTQQVSKNVEEFETYDALQAPLVGISISARKRSADDQNNNNSGAGALEFQSNNEDNNNLMNFAPDNSQGKVSVSSKQSHGILPATSADIMMQSSYSGYNVKQSESAIGLQFSQLPSSQKSGSHRTLEYYYCKQQYQKTVNRLMEDPSSVWYDNLEQMKKDYQDMKEIYDVINQMNLAEYKQMQMIGTPQMQTSATTESQMLESSSDLEESKQAILNPSRQISVMGKRALIGGEDQYQQTLHAQNNLGYRAKIYDHFVRQRRNTDLWGRSLLLKPDRKYKQRKFLISHKYFVHEMLKNLFAVSILEDSDFPDYQEAIRLMELQEQQKQKDENGNPIQQENPQTLMRKPLPQSEQFKRLRDMLMSKIEQNDFLYSLLSNPEEFLSDEKPFDFHPLTKHIDPSIVMQLEVQYITVEGAQFGELYLSTQYLMFKSRSEKTPRSYRFAMKRDEVVKKRNKIWHFSNLEQIFKRRFLLLHQACEFYTREKKSYFFNMLNEDKCTEFLIRVNEIVKRHNKQHSQRKVEVIDNHPRHEFKKKKYYDDWVKGNRSTQEFLLLLNKYSGRSFNDFGQYPIFPWVVSDYSCSYEVLKKKTDKLDGEGFRDLTKNSGILSDKKLEYAKLQYEQSIEGDEMIYGDQKYHLKFGFSNRLFTLGYLIRMEPFTDNFIKVNGGLDNPDRIFYSFQDQWKSILEDKQNNCELTPEFFYLPELFRNHNLSYLGKARNGWPVNEVTLPEWSKNEHDFIRIHRDMLESKPVAKKIRYWIDLLFGAKQRDEANYNTFYCYAYEGYVRSRKEEIADHNIETILEFLQVPQQVFSEPLFKIDKKQTTQLTSMQITQCQQINFNLPNIDEMAEDEHEDGGIGQSDLGSVRPGIISRNLDGRQVSQAPPSLQLKQGKLGGKIQQSQQLQAYKSQRETETLGATQQIQTNQGQDFKNSSLIQKFIDSAQAGPNNKRYENELKKIQESHKIDKPEDRNIFHMAFSQLNGKCFVFLNDSKDNGTVKCVVCRESFLQEELRNLCNLGLKTRNLKGDFNNIFQLYGGGIGDRGATSQKNPLLFTCQNIDNSIKVFDLSIKKGSQLVYQESSHNNMVTAIKFSIDYKYFISGDANGVMHHYMRTSDEDEQAQLPSQQMITQGNKTTEIPSDSKKVFPFVLNSKYQDQYGAILGIDINFTLDMFVTASRDGTIALRCLRSAQLWRLITLEKLQSEEVELLTLKLSLHGYIIIMMKNERKVYTFVYSLNGDLLLSTQRDSEQFEFKYAQLTQNEDNLIMVFNQLRKEDKELQGVIRVCRLYDMDNKRDNLQRTFYPMIHQIIYGQEGAGGKGKGQASRRTPISMSESIGPQAAKQMPGVMSFALSQDESKMNLFLKTGEIICFDESRSQIIEQLDDFGLA